MIGHLIKLLELQTRNAVTSGLAGAPMLQENVKNG